MFRVTFSVLGKIKCVLHHLLPALKRLVITVAQLNAAAGSDVVLQTHDHRGEKSKWGQTGGVGKEEMNERRFTLHLHNRLFHL